MEKNMIALPNGITIDESVLPLFSWSRCSGDAGYNGNFEGHESWTVLVETGCGENRIVALGYESRDPDGNWDLGVYPEEGFFIGEDAYEQACEAWRFNW